MIEFVMSRVWMVFAGVALMAVVVGAFNELDRETGDQAALDGARSLAELMEEMRSSGQAGEVRVDARDLVLDDRRSLVVRDGSIWVKGWSGEKGIAAPSGIILSIGKASVPELTIHRSDVLMLRSVVLDGGGLSLQLEKVEATISTASTNRLASSSVL